MEVQVVCQKCGSLISIPYLRLGSTVQCGNCLEDTKPVIPNGTQLPDTGYAISYSDFRKLLEYAPFRSEVEPLIEQWLGYSLVTDGEYIRPLNDKGEEIDTLSLHLRIQASSDMQRKLYQTAMAVWR